MKKSIPIAFLMFLLLVTSLAGQNKMALDDRAQLLSADAESALKNRLKEDGIELTSVVDFRNRCDYWYASLYTQGGTLFLSIRDCYDNIAGTKDMGVAIVTAADTEKALLVYFAITEMLRAPAAPGAYPTAMPARTLPPPPPDPGEHRSRYFFAPSSYNLEQGELYYNSIYFFVHDVQYGLSDKFSIGMGTTILGFPFYLTPKLTIPVNERSTFAIGDILMFGTWGADFFGNLLYGTYTRGTYQSNITLGLGHLAGGGKDNPLASSSLVFNFSALGGMSDHIFFITENYMSSSSTTQTAYYSNYNPVTGIHQYRDEEFSQGVFFWFGMAGFRFINKKEDVKSWQLGLSYLYTSREQIPSKYTGSSWNTSSESGTRFIAFPVIGFTRKFGTRF
jgi:hypothetical protein